MGYIEARKSNKGKTVSYRAHVKLRGAKRVSKTFRRRASAVEWVRRTEAEVQDFNYLTTREAENIPWPRPSTNI